jgi:hypothetical protein
VKVWAQAVGLLLGWLVLPVLLGWLVLLPLGFQVLLRRVPAQGLGFL